MPHFACIMSYVTYHLPPLTYHALCHVHVTRARSHTLSHCLHVTYHTSCHVLRAAGYCWNLCEPVIPCTKCQKRHILFVQNISYMTVRFTIRTKLWKSIKTFHGTLISLCLSLSLSVSLSLCLYLCFCLSLSSFSTVSVAYYCSLMTWQLI